MLRLNPTDHPAGTRVLYHYENPMIPDASTRERYERTIVEWAGELVCTAEQGVRRWYVAAGMPTDGWIVDAVLPPAPSIDWQAHAELLAAAPDVPPVMPRCATCRWYEASRTGAWCSSLHVVSAVGTAPCPPPNFGCVYHQPREETP